MSDDYDDFQIELRALERDLELMQARIENIQDWIEHEYGRGIFDNE